MKRLRIHLIHTLLLMTGLWGIFMYTHALATEPLQKLLQGTTEERRGRIQHIDLPAVTISDRVYLLGPSTEVRIGNQRTSEKNLIKGMVVDFKFMTSGEDGPQPLLQVIAR